MTQLARFPHCAGVATLTARETLTPRMIRVTLQAEGFRDTAWPRRQPGEIITLLFCPPGEEVVLPVKGWVFPDGVNQDWRNYTVRRHRPETGEIEVDVVLHEPRGPACTWAAEAPVGGDVGYAGPRVDFAPRDDVDWLLLCGDETALPAIAAVLEQDETARHKAVLAVVEVPDATEEQGDIALPPNAELHWVHRDGAPPATTSHLADRLRTLPLPDGPGQAWGAAESKIAKDLRTVLRDERGLPKTHAHARGYWLRSGDWILDED